MSLTDLGRVPVAVVGMACRMPGADNLDEYWDMLASGRSPIGPVPEHRLNRELYLTDEKGRPGFTYTDVGGIVEDRPVDRSVCPISDDLIEMSDIAHLNICEVASAAFANAGYDPSCVPDRRTGVYVGHSSGSDRLSGTMFRNYFGVVAKLSQESGVFDGMSVSDREALFRQLRREVNQRFPDVTGGRAAPTGAAVASGLIAKVHGLNGPTVAIDAACASSHMSIGLAVQALQRGQVDMALAGGASYSKWLALVLFSMARSISANRSCPFDASADGLISSDGYGIVVLKTLPKAIADGDKILSVIRGLGISSDGRGKSLWAPMTKGQIKAVDRAYSGSVTPDSLQYIECHATSTQVGDATELSSLAASFGGRVKSGRRIPIGSVKANVGHTLEAAGVAGVIKAVLSMQHGQIPKQINFETPNPDIDWDNVPFEVVRETRDWQVPEGAETRRCAVNSFGIGGLNVHVVMDQCAAAEELAQFGAGKPTSVPAAMSAEPVAVIGSSVITPGALNQAAFWELVNSSTDPKKSLPEGRCWTEDVFRQADSPLEVATTRGGYIDNFEYDWKRHKVPPKQIRDANPLQFMLLDAADQALSDAGFDEREPDREMTSVLVGSMFHSDFTIGLTLGVYVQQFQDMLRPHLRSAGMDDAGIEAACETLRDHILKNVPGLLDETGSFTCSTLASRLSKSFDFMGGAAAIDSDELSSLTSLNAAVGMLQTGHSNMVLCAAGQQSMDAHTFHGLKQGGVLSSSDQQKAPLDAGFDGVVPAEGVAVVVLKRLSDAVRDGDRIRGVIRGAAETYVPNDVDSAACSALERALDAAKLSKKDVGLIEATGLETRREQEVQLLRDVLTDRDGLPVISTSVSPQIGYIKGASGLVSFVKSLLEFEHGTVPSQFGFDAPADPIKELTDVVPGQPTPITASTDDDKAAVAITHFSPEGFGAAVVMESFAKYPKPKTSQWPQAKAASTSRRREEKPGTANRFQYLSAPSRLDLGNRLQRLMKLTAEQIEDASQNHFQESDLVRIAFPISDRDPQPWIAAALEGFSARGDAEKLIREGVYLADFNFASLGRTGGLFPGQGSQYAGMCDQLIAQSISAQKAFNEFDAILEAEGCQRFEGLRRQSDVLSVQLAMLMADALYSVAARETGFFPEVVAGHSYGEYAALFHAGAWDFRSAVQATKHRAVVVDTFAGTGGAMTSISADRSAVERLVKPFEGQVYIANVNGPRQIVVGGEVAALEAFESCLQAERVAFKRLNVPAAYHTPLLGPAVNDFRDRLAGIPLAAPQTVFVSSVGNVVVNDPEQIREALAVQLVTPMDYVGLIDVLRQQGVTTCIELGPKQVLSKLAGQIAPASKLLCLAADRRGEPWNIVKAHLNAVLRVRGHHDGTIGNAVSRLPRHQVLGASRSNTATPATEARNGHSPVRNGAVSSQKTPASNGHPAAPKSDVPSKRINSPAPPIPATPSRAAQRMDSTPSEIIFFDATAPRKEANRQQALARKQGAAAAAKSPTAPVREAKPEVALPPAAAMNQAAPAAASAVPQPVTSAQTAAAPVRVPKRDELEKFAVEYIVDQTGYPEDMVELDADLEADLGIDSIKKAQMLGEMAQKFELNWLAEEVADLSLDDFTTLASIVGFLTEAGERAKSGGASTPSTAATVVPSTVAAPAQQSRSAAPAVTPSAAAAPAPAASSPAAPAVTGPIRVPERSELETFAVEYIVDQTGYPEDMVELDADLEADLGIDSIKKAQMLGEMAQKFELNWLAEEVADLSLDDFTTLDSIVGFLTDAGERAKSGTPSPEAASPVAASPAPTPTPPAAAPAAQVASTPATSEYRFVVPTRETPDSPVAVPTAGAASATAVAPALAATVAAASDPIVVPERSELEAFAVDYIVDQTGYPEDMVELDADLEADLGIDSIKKAQMLGEMAQKFELNWLADEVADLSLDDFTTLESIVGFLVDAGDRQKKNDRAAVAASEPRQVDAVAPADEPLTESTSVEEAVAESPGTIVPATPASIEASPSPVSVGDAALVEVVENAGQPYDLGVAHGKAMGEHIKTILMRQVERYGERLTNMPELDQALANPGRYFGDPEIEELQGIADGAGIPMESVVAHNLAMCEDYVPGCVQFAVKAAANGGALIHSANEDSSMTLTLGDCLKRVVQFRAPEGGFKHVCFSIAGQLAGLNGFNETGLAITSTLMLDRTPRDVTRRGNIHPVIVNRVLSQCSSVQQAVELMESTARNGAWTVCVSDTKTDEMVYIEYDADEISVSYPDSSLIGSNHALMLQPTMETPDHSLHRLHRLQELVEARSNGSISDQDVQEILRDQFDRGRNRVTAHPTMNTIRRVDNQISVVMRPADRVLQITPGPMNPAVSGTFVTVDAGDFFGSVDATPAASQPPTVEVSDAMTRTPIAAADPFAGLPANDERLMRRVIVDTTRSPLSSTPWRPTGAVIVYGSGSQADAFAAELQSAGVSVHHIATGVDPSAVSAGIEAANADHLVVFMPTGHEQGRTFSQTLTTTFAGVQRFVAGIIERNVVESASVSFATFQGGDFGFSGTVYGEFGGAAAGLAKGLRREFPTLRMKCVDFSAAADATQVAEQLSHELNSSSPVCEVAFVDGERLEVSGRPAPLTTDRATQPTAGATWIVTGGARGVTAVVAHELGKRFGLRLHLVGSSPLPTVDPAWLGLDEAGLKELKKQTFAEARDTDEKPIDAWKRREKAIEVASSLQHMTDDGVEFTYHSCDVSSPTAVAELVNTIRKSAGSIEGVIHGAGVEAACRFDRKQLPIVEKTYSVKVDGARYLANELAADGLKFFVGFGSVSGRFGGLGQTDYSSSSDALAKAVSGLREQLSGCRLVTFHWPPWGDVGMAARPESRIALESAGVSFMPPLEGAAFVIDELCSGSSQTEITVIDKPDGMDLDNTLPPLTEWDQFPAEESGSQQPHVNEDVSLAAASSTASGFETSGAPAGFPFRSNAIDASADSWSATMTIDPTVEPLLLNHQASKRPLMPGAGMVAIFAQTAKHLLRGDGLVRLENFLIGKSLLYRNDAPAEVTVVATGNSGRVDLQLFNRSASDAVLATASASLVSPDVVADYATRGKPKGSMFPTVYPDHGLIYHGPALRVVQEMACRRSEAVGRLKGSPVHDLLPAAADGAVNTHPGLIDGCFYAAGVDAWFHNEDRVELPKGLNELIVAADPVEAGTCNMWLKHKETRDDGSTYDIRLYDPNGNIVYAINGFHTVSKGPGEPL